jgi:transposase, IS5 family
MAEKRTGQLSLVEAFLPGVLEGSGHLDAISGLVKWYRFEKLLGSRSGGGAGHPAYPSLLLFKMVLLQSLYGLSDAATEDAVSDRLSFRRFCGLSLEDGVPDHTTLCRYRQSLQSAGLLARLFDELDRQMEKAGVVLKRGTMLDATVIETAAARPPPMSREGEVAVAGRDPDAGFGKRTGRPGSKYGYKAHVGVDVGSGLVRAVVTTAADVPDTVPADLLIRGDEAAVLADAAYHTKAREKALRAAGIKCRLMRRPNKHQRKLPARLKRYNRLIARRRAAVETTFATWKRRMGFTAIRYVGLAKASAQVTLVAMAFNLRRWVTLAAAA